MKISECVGFLESQVERLKEREADLMRRGGELLERARKAELQPKDLEPSIGPEMIDYLIAADNVVMGLMMVHGKIPDPSLKELHNEAQEARNLVRNRLVLLRTRYAEKYAKERAAEACRSTS